MQYMQCNYFRGCNSQNLYGLGPYRAYYLSLLFDKIASPPPPPRRYVHVGNKRKLETLFFFLRPEKSFSDMARPSPVVVILADLRKCRGLKLLFRNISINKARLSMHHLLPY